MKSRVARLSVYSAKSRHTSTLRRSAHLVDLRSAAGQAQRFEESPAVPAPPRTDFVAGAVHDRSARMAEWLKQSGADTVAAGLLFGPPAVAVLSTLESLGASRLGTFLPLLPRKDAVRGGAIFFLFVLAILLPLKLLLTAPSAIGQWRSALSARGSDAMRDIEGGASALESGDLSAARSSFIDAEQRLRAIGASVGVVGRAVSDIGPHIPFVQGVVGAPFASLTIGTELARAAVSFTDGLSALGHVFDASASEQSLTAAQTAFTGAHDHAEKASQALERVDVGSIPVGLRDQLSRARAALEDLMPSLAVLPDRVALFAGLMGQARPMRYLVVFENNAELRPAGGFAGSVALVDVDRGHVRNIEIPQGGSYDLQGSERLQLLAPEPLRRFHARWEFQDTNWFADWPTSSRTMMAFYEKGGGPSVDGVIGLTTTALEELLGVVGPVSVPGEHATLSKENAFTMLQSTIEQAHASGSIRPKAVLRPLAQQLLARVFTMTPAQTLALLPALETLIRGRDVTVYVKDPALEGSVIAAGIGGEMRQNASGDYLSVVSANIGGGKSDRVVQDAIHLETRVAPDGTMESTVKLQRTHHGVAGAPFVGVANISYIRFYVPKGSVLLSASGFTPEAGLVASGRAAADSDGELSTDSSVQERPGVGTVDPTSRTRVTEEFGKTVFGNWLIVDPQQRADVEIRYRLPLSIPLTTDIGRYTLFVQKQPGTRAQTFSFSLQLPAGWTRTDAGADAHAQNADTNVPLDRDRVFGSMIMHT